MRQVLSFNSRVAGYEEWYEEHPFVFRSEVEALRQMLPEGGKLTGMAVGSGTGRFSQALDIKEGIEPSGNMRQVAIERGIDVIDSHAGHLPYADLRFDFVLMSFCISYFSNLHPPFLEAHRVLKENGALVIGFADPNSPLVKYYESRKNQSVFYRYATFYTVDKVMNELTKAGFRHFNFCQTLFKPPNEITEIEPAKPGYGKGSFVVIQARKKSAEPEANPGGIGYRA